VQLRGKLLDQFTKTFVKIKGQRCANTLPTVTSLIGHMSILDECPGEGYKLCRKKLHWYKIEIKQCRECGRIAAKSRYHNNPELKQKIIAAAIEYEKKNKEKINARKRERYKTDLEYKEKERARRNKKFKERWATNEEWRKKKIQKTKDWFEKNKDAQIAYANKKKAKRLKAVALWADKKAIRELYRIAAIKTKETGVKHHVDHVYPLKSPFLCGLHVETNLQVITAEENLRKRNLYWPGQLDCQKGSVYDIFPKELTKLLND